MSWENAPQAAPLPPTISRLPIFPLPSVHLFPGMLLPLHVFEPRYRALTRACLAENEGARWMALPALLPGYQSDYDGRPAVATVCGVGEILEHHEFPDGRFDVLLRGVGRVRIVAELPANEPYRLVSAVRLDDKPAALEGAFAHMASLTALCDRLASLIPHGGETLRNLARQECEPGRASDVLAGALLTDAADRQRVLEMLDVGQRLECVTAAVVVLVRRFQCGKEKGDQGSRNN